MTETEQNILIAEACGWVPETVIVLVWICKSVREGVAIGEWQDQNQILYSKDGHQFRPENLPSYLNDLNAMHEAEKVLKEGERDWEGVTKLQRTYYQYLGYRQPEMGDSYSNRPQAICHATAAQRAEAFLRAIGKWKQAS